MTLDRKPSADPARIRLYTPQSLGSGESVALDAGQAHYLKRVMRKARGDGLRLFNGRDGEWRAVVAELARNRASVRCEECLTPQRAEPDLWLLFAPIKFGRIDFLAAKATELGVSALGAVMTEHTQAARVNENRLRANAIKAAEQTGRLSVPEVLATRPLNAVLANWTPRRRLMVCDETGGAPIAEALGAAAVVGGAGGGASGPWAVLIGPEGGFSGAELAALRGHTGVLRVSLGPRLLRADTAALAALACWQAMLGDWPGGGPK
jgi:16S rRNA (uracil1498-N3)-methyltransferase